MFENPLLSDFRVIFLTGQERKTSRTHRYVIPISVKLFSYLRGFSCKCKEATTTRTPRVLRPLLHWHTLSVRSTSGGGSDAAIAQKDCKDGVTI